MEDNRQRLQTEIDNYLVIIKDNENRISKIVEQLKDKNLKEEEIAELTSELEYLQDENEEYNKDIAMLEEVLYKMDLTENERSCSPYEERYDSWDEVFTGGDY